jgi:hypothetical protein
MPQTYEEQLNNFSLVGTSNNNAKLSPQQVSMLQEQRMSPNNTSTLSQQNQRFTNQMMQRKNMRKPPIRIIPPLQNHSMVQHQAHQQIVAAQAADHSAYHHSHQYMQQMQQMQQMQ